MFAGIIARYPFGGVTWCSLMYLLGLRALGHEVFYIEDTGECVYDPDAEHAQRPIPRYGTRYIHDALEPFGLGDRWTFVNYDGSYHGRIARRRRRFCADADLFINLSGGSWFWRDEYATHPAQGVHRLRSGVHTAGDRQGRSRGTSSSSSGFDHLFTFGANIGTPASADARSATSPGTRPGSRSYSTTGERRAARGDRFTR